MTLEHLSKSKRYCYIKVTPTQYKCTREFYSKNISIHGLFKFHLHEVNVNLLIQEHLSYIINK